jgi:hypothetical protein
MSARDAFIDMPPIAPPVSAQDVLAVTEPSSRPTPTRDGILHATVDVPAGSPPKDARPSPPRWATPEFYVYYVTAAVIIPLMVWVPRNLSSRES